MFIRLFRPKEDKELLINVAHISMIEITYAVPGADGNYWRASLDDGFANPAAVRFYRLHVRGEQMLLLSNPDDPVMQALEEIYKSALKGRPGNH